MKTPLQDTGGSALDRAVEQIEGLLAGRYVLSKRAIARLLLQDDEQIREMVKVRDARAYEQVERIVVAARQSYSDPLDYVIAMRRQQEINDLLQDVVEPAGARKSSFAETLSRWTMNPATGIPILLLVVYLGLYKFVGQFGAGTLVDFLESHLFDRHINPFLIEVVGKLTSQPALRDLFVGEYGVFTLGLRYAVGIILPIVAVFFLMFSVIEDVGYLPRLALLIDRLFKRIGLSGRAVIPMVLGLGCDTMATMVTRTLPTRRERFIATMLLALAVPCSAQLGVILALLHGHRLALAVWAGVIIAVFLFVGYLASKLLPGTPPMFYMEVPPLRLPKISNILIKTYTRVVWYLKEIVPIFLVASVLIWIGQETGIFAWCINLLKYPVRLMGLPPEAASVFLLGFFRRDYGAAGLYDLNDAGVLTGVQLVVASVALTLFLPCIAQLLMNIKERGIKTGLLISGITLLFSFGVAFSLNAVLQAVGAVL
ncbi:MAG: ferrous iron transporter B [Planctomycetes bacterium]|nr:ferrous iron transporter B [Planctomycetota bacterium]